jgi:hypothetical protein
LARKATADDVDGLDAISLEDGAGKLSDIWETGDGRPVLAKYGTAIFVILAKSERCDSDSLKSETKSANS